MRNLIKIGGLLIVFLIVFAVDAFAQKGLYLSDPNVNGTGKTYRWLEVGSKVTVNIMYERTSNQYNGISGAMLYMTYDKNKIDKPTIQLSPQFADYLTVSQQTVTDNEIQIQIGLNTARKPIAPLPIADDTVIATLSFHLVQNNANDGQDLTLKWNTNTNLVQVSVSTAAGGTAVDTKSTNSLVGVTLEQGKTPVFSGLDSSPTNPALGNTLDLKWTTNAGLSSDKKANAETLYPDSKLRYKVYRSTGGAAFDPNSKVVLETIASFTTRRDGPGDGTPAGANPIKDGTKYWYKVTAIDDVYNDSGNANPNEQLFSEVTEGSETPTDTTAPLAPSLTVAPGDKKNTLTIGNYAADAGGIVIIRRDDGSAVTDAANKQLGSANADYTHGPEIKEGDPLLGGTVIFAGFALNNRGTTLKSAPTPANIIPTFDDDGLTNGKTYHYQVVAYDRAVGDIAAGTLVEMGRNYSASSGDRSGTPGVSPDPITNFYSISRAQQGEITLRWDNSPNYDTKPQGASIIWYTTDPVKKWSAIPSVPSQWADAAKMTGVKLLAVKERVGKDNTTDEIVKAIDAEGNTLKPEDVCYFKIFAVNKTDVPPTLADLKDPNKISTYYFSPGPIAAAAATIGGSGGAGFKGQLLGATTDKLTFNTVFTPKDVPAASFYNFVSTNTGRRVLSVYGWENGKSVGVTFDAAGTASDPNFVMKKGIAYQVYVDQDTTAELDTNSIP